MVLTLNRVLICVTILSIVVAVSMTVIGSWSVNRFSGLSHNTFTLPDNDQIKKRNICYFIQPNPTFLPTYQYYCYYYYNHNSACPHNTDRGKVYTPETQEKRCDNREIVWRFSVRNSNSSVGKQTKTNTHLTLSHSPRHSRVEKSAYETFCTGPVASVTSETIFI